MLPPAPCLDGFVGPMDDNSTACAASDLSSSEDGEDEEYDRLSGGPTNHENDMDELDEAAEAVELSCIFDIVSIDTDDDLACNADQRPLEYDLGDYGMVRLNNRKGNDSDLSEVGRSAENTEAAVAPHAVDAAHATAESCAAGVALVDNDGIDARDDAATDDSVSIGGNSFSFMEGSTLRDMQELTESCFSSSDDAASSVTAEDSQPAWSDAGDPEGTPILGVIIKIFREDSLSESYVPSTCVTSALPFKIANIIADVRDYTPIHFALRDEDVGSVGETWSAYDMIRRLDSQIFYRPGENELIRRSDQLPVLERAIPFDAGEGNRVPCPVPDLVYGYNADVAFPTHGLPAERFQAGMFNSEGLVFPFLVVQTTGSETATNAAGLFPDRSRPCQAALAASVYANKKLLDGARHELDLSPVLNNASGATFGISVGPQTARLFVSWIQSGVYVRSTEVAQFRLDNFTHFLYFRRHVTSIIDWAMGRRLRWASRVVGALV